MMTQTVPNRSARPRLMEVLGRGWRRRCPRCGEGQLFVRWIHPHERCSECGLVFQRDQGDNWMFIIITDRIPILFGIAAVYFGFEPQHWYSILGFLTALAAPVLATMRERQGMALGLNYLVNFYSNEVAQHSPTPDPSPSLPAAR